MSIRRLRWLYVLQGAALGLLFPYLVPLLADRGLSATGIGLVLGASGLVSLASYPVWGALADGPLGRERSVTAAAAIAAAGGLWVMVAGADPVALTGAVSLALVGALPWGPISDAIALESLGERSSSYGRLRAWASLGWAVTAIAAGIAWGIVGGTVTFVSFAVFALAVGAIVLAPSGGLGRMRRALASDTVAAWAEAPVGGIRRARASRGDLRLLLASPIMLGFLVGLLLTSIGEHASWRYVALRILDQGGGTMLVGLAAALPALVEIPVFMGSRRLERVMGLRRVYVTGALLAAVLTFLIALSPEAWMAALFRTADGTSYALRYIGMVLIIGALLPVRLHALGQSIGWLVSMGVAPIVADSVGGIVYDTLGGSAVFVAASLLALVGAGVTYVALAGAGLGRSTPAVPVAAPLPVPRDR